MFVCFKDIMINQCNLLFKKNIMIEKYLLPKMFETNKIIFRRRLDMSRGVLGFLLKTKI